MLEYLPYIWIAIIVLAVMIKASTTSLISICFIPSGIIALILCMFAVAEWIQILLFFVISFILLFLSKTLLRKFSHIKK